MRLRLVDEVPCSSLMKRGAGPVSLLQFSRRDRARPRSMILTVLSRREPASRQLSGRGLLSITFSGLRSRCMASCSCRCATAPRSWHMMLLASGSLSAPRASSIHCNVGPRQSSMTRCMTPLHSTKASIMLAKPRACESRAFRSSSRRMSCSSCAESTPEQSSAGTSTILSAASVSALAGPLLSHTTRHTVPKPPLPIGSPWRTQRAATFAGSALR
mmetsp:Transcript_20709/g.42389  ORF Transcript_20709/g.42389 Transcript_20709/m.42389 type:complete len:216 (+) Transcript_20709:631-1278(+)